MSSFVVGGGKVDAEGFLKGLLLNFKPGVTRALNVTQRGAGANMSVDVNLDAAGYAGSLLVTSANIPYIGWIDAITNVTVTTADPSNPRIDVVVAYVDLSAISTGVTNNVGAYKFKAVTGTAAGSPVAPNTAAIQASVVAGNPYTILANVAVPAASSSVVTANITDTRTYSTLASDPTVIRNTDTNTVLAAMLSTSAITLGYADGTGTASGITTTPTDVTGVTVTVTVPAGGRRVEIDANCELESTVGGDGGNLSILEDGTVIRTVTVACTPAATRDSKRIVFSKIPTAGSHTYKLQVVRGSGSGSLSFNTPGSIHVKAV